MQIGVSPTESKTSPESKSRLSTPSPRGYSFRQIFIVSNIVIMGIGLVFGAVLLTSLYQNQKKGALLRLENEVSKAQTEIDRRLELAELYVTQLSELSTALASADPSSFIRTFTHSSRRLLETDPSQYETCLALEPEYAKRISGKAGFLLVISKDRKRVGKEDFNNPATFSTSIFTDGGYLHDPEAMWYHETKKSLDRIFHTPFYFEETYTQELLTSIGKAVIDRNGKMIGVANIDLTADTFSTFLDGIRIGETGGVLVTDSENRPIVPLLGSDRPILGYHYDPALMKRIGFPLHLGNIQLSDTRDKSGYYPGADGNVYLTLALPLKHRSWKIFAYQKRSEAFAPVYRSLFSMIAIGLVLLAFLIWTAQKVQRVVFTSVNRILTNIDMNSSLVEKDEKDLSFQPIPSEGPKEIQRLSCQLNRLYEKLHHALSDLRIARSKAEQATIAKSRFLSVMSHEIRTPLHAMLGMADVLGSETTDESQIARIHVIQRTGRTLQRILNDILDFTRIEAGKLVLDHHEFRIFDLLSELTALLEPEAKAKNLRFEIIPPEINSIVIGDSLRLKQVLLNLLGNALKFTKTGFIELRVESTRAQHPEFRDFTFFVSDSGIGISKDQQDKLFSDFTQAENSISRRFGGTGLGLAISKQIVELLGGTLQVKSELGSGSTFFFQIRFQVKGVEPGSYSPHSGRSAQPGSEFLTLSIPRHAKRARILVVDDDEDNHSLIEAYLKSGFDLQIVHAYNGKEALNLIRETGAFDLVVMDIQMPEMDGLEVVRTIRQLESSSPGRRRMPIIMLSANTFTEDRFASLDAGADGHMGKPIERSTFIKTVQPWIQ